MSRRGNKRRLYDDDTSDVTTPPPFEMIDVNIKNIGDLIKLGRIYNPRKRRRYNIDLALLSDLVEPLEALEAMIGMKEVKESLTEQIVYFLQGLHDGKLDMIHTVITGPPGVGKTELARILGRIYLRMGILSSDRFFVAKRSDLIAKYVGQTADKTQKVINSCRGGVLVIDEAYQLGDPDHRDSYSKECIDTLNQNLTENKENFMCIIVGYKNALDECFFSVNPGLERRFTFRYNIEAYSPEELRLILLKIIRDQGWSAHESSTPLSFFTDNYKSFPNFGGDMESLFFYVKISYSMRIFGKLPQETHKEIQGIDLEHGFKAFLEKRPKKTPEPAVLTHLYI